MSKKVALFVLIGLCVSYILITFVAPEILWYLTRRATNFNEWPYLVPATITSTALLGFYGGFAFASGAQIGGTIGAFMGPLGFLVGAAIGGF